MKVLSLSEGCKKGPFSSSAGNQIIKFDKKSLELDIFDAALNLFAALRNIQLAQTPGVSSELALAQD